MNAYLERLNDEWLDDFVYISKSPLENRGYKIIPFNDHSYNLEKFKITKSDICIGSVEACNKFFELCGVPTPESITYPEELKQYLGRTIEETTFKSLDNNYPYFIKPSKNVKLFTGDIIYSDSSKKLIMEIYNCSLTTPIFKSSVVNFISEYRVFVSLGNIYGIKHYKGDFTEFINVDVVRQMVASYKNCPKAYTLDVGLTDSGETLLVEVNDMWAIGSYGFDSTYYVLLCERRMKEILNK